MIVELRQYTLHPGVRDRFVAVFEAHLVASQAAVGMQVVGTFRDADDPDRFVWIRSFPDMAARRGSLEAFYLVPSAAWRDHGAEANAMMVDSDDVLLLEPRAGWAAPTGPVATPDVAVTVWPGPVDPGVPHLVTADEANDVPWLPVRDEQVTVVVGPAPVLDVAPLQVLRLTPTPGSAFR